jgi:hypothetical protein
MLKGFFFFFLCHLKIDMIFKHTIEFIIYYINFERTQERACHILLLPYTIMGSVRLVFSLLSWTLSISLRFFFLDMSIQGNGEVGFELVISASLNMIHSRLSYPLETISPRFKMKKKYFLFFGWMNKWITFWHCLLEILIFTPPKNHLS